MYNFEDLANGGTIVVLKAVLDDATFEGTREEA